MAEHDAVTGTAPDTDLQLKKRARRRLVGAAALALLAVIVLPLVMDHEPRPPVQDIQMRIPAQDAGGISGRLLSKRAGITPLPAVTEKTENKDEPVSAVPPPGAPAPAGVSAVKNQPAQPVGVEKKSPTEAAKPAPAPMPVSEKPVAEQKSAKDASSPWVVQLGAYKDAGNAKHLLAKLKGIHVPAYTENIDTPQGPRVRVRAGPFANREAAEKARARLKIIGVDGPVAPK
jgi:DedD protein